jgi:hypothetical protein
MDTNFSYLVDAVAYAAFPEQQTKMLRAGRLRQEELRREPEGNACPNRVPHRPQRRVWF